MGKKISTKAESPKMGIELALNHFPLSSREKFVCLKVFSSEGDHTLDEWKQLLTKKDII